MRYTGVAISGRAGSGKDRFARAIGLRAILEGKYPEYLAFADSLKMQVYRETGMNDKTNPAFRQMLIEVGLRERKKNARVWLNPVASAYDSLSSDDGCVTIVTDMRFRNEYEWAKRAGALLVRVDATVMDRAAALQSRGEGIRFATADEFTESQLDDDEYHLRFWNPHGDAGEAIRWAAQRVMDMLMGRENERQETQ